MYKSAGRIANRGNRPVYGSTKWFGTKASEQCKYREHIKSVGEARKIDKSVKRAWLATKAQPINQPPVLVKRTSATVSPSRRNTRPHYEAKAPETTGPLE